MVKQLIRYIGIFLALIALGPVAGATSTLSSSTHSDHKATSCQIACQATPQRQEDNLRLGDNEKDDEKDTTLVFGDDNLATSGVGLLQENAIWKQSSWVPPDLLLQSGAYSTSL